MARGPALITGVVKDRNGAPAPAVRVYFTSAPVPFHDVAVLTDDAGGFTLTAPAAGSYTIACASDDAPVVSATVEVKGGRPAQVSFTLERG